MNAPRTRLPSAPVLALILLTCFVTEGSTADRDFMLSQRGDDALRAYCEKVIPFAEQAREEGTTGAVILVDTHLLDIQDEHSTFQNNRLLTRLDELDEDVATQAIPVQGIEVEKVEAFVVRRDGSIERFDLEDDKIRLTEEEVDLGRRVVIGFPQVEPGDVFGYSLQTRLDSKLYQKRIDLADEWPVRYGQIHVLTGNRLAYNVCPQNIDADEYRLEAVEKDRTYPTLSKFTWARQAAVGDDPMAPPRDIRTPHVWIAHYGDYDLDWASWFINNNWNTWATSLWASTMLDDEIHDDVVALAEEVTEGIEDPIGRADALHTWVQDEIVLADALEIGSEAGFTPSEEIVERRTATGLEKSMLLNDLMRGVDLEPVPVLLRAASLGGLDAANPGLWQFSHLALVLVDESESSSDPWYCPAAPGCPPRALPPDLRGVQALHVVKDPQEVYDDAISAAVRSSSVPETQMRNFQRHIAASGIARFVRTPGDPDETVGHTTEILQLDPVREVFRAEVVADGFTALTRHRTVDDLHGTAETWWSNRFPDDEITVAGVDRDLSTPGRIRLEVSSELEAGPIPEAQGDVWILDVASFFGETPLSGLQLGSRRSSLWIPRSEEFVFETWLPLPDGWSSARLAAPATVEGETFGYSLGVAVDEGRVCVRREIRLRRSDLEPNEFDAEREAWREAMDLESTPLVLERMDTGK